MSEWYPMAKLPEEEGEYLVKYYKPFSGYKYRVVYFYIDKWFDEWRHSKWRMLKWTEIPEDE